MDSLQKALSDPKTLEEKRLANKLLVDSYGSAEVSEGNLMSMLTIGKFAVDDPEAEAALKQVGKYEVTPILEAAKLLWAQTDEGLRLRMKFGGDLRGAIALSKVVKAEAEDIEARELIASAAKGMVKANAAYKSTGPWVAAGGGGGGGRGTGGTNPL